MRINIPIDYEQIHAFCIRWHVVELGGLWFCLA